MIRQQWWQRITRRVQTLDSLPRRVGSYRRERERRLMALRQFTALHDWNVIGLSDDLSARWPIPLLKGSLSAQAELAVVGDWQDRPALVASILVQPASVPMARSGRRAGDLIVLLTALHVGRNDRELIATCTAGTIDIMGRTDSVARLQQPLRVLLGGAVQSGAFREGDTLKLGDVDVIVAHRINARHESLDVGSRLDLLVEVARLLASE